MIHYYDWAGGREAVFGLGPAAGPVVVFALPLLEEHNRTRTFVVTLMRALAKHGIASALPDLPGTGESLTPMCAIDLAVWHQAFTASVVAEAVNGRTVFGAGIRGGALLDTAADVAGRWHFAPLTGAAQVRELMRLANMGRPAGAAALRLDELAASEEQAVEIAGTSVPAKLLLQLEGVNPAAARVVRLEGDGGPCTRSIAGATLWRRAEPDNDPELAQHLADDIADWIAACAA